MSTIRRPCFSTRPTWRMWWKMRQICPGNCVHFCLSVFVRKHLLKVFKNSQKVDVADPGPTLTVKESRISIRLLVCSENYKEIHEKWIIVYLYTFKKNLFLMFYRFICRFLSRTISVFLVSGSELAKFCICICIFDLCFQTIFILFRNGWTRVISSTRKGSSPSTGQRSWRPLWTTRRDSSRAAAGASSTRRATAKAMTMMIARRTRTLRWGFFPRCGSGSEIFSRSRMINNLDPDLIPLVFTENCHQKFNVKSKYI